jgi:hypothetical protein
VLKMVVVTVIAWLEVALGETVTVTTGLEAGAEEEEPDPPVSSLPPMMPPFEFAAPLPLFK